MYSKIKYLETFTVMSLVSILTVTGFVDESSAASEASRTIHQFVPSSDKICGDKLCSETGGKTLMPWEKVINKPITPPIKEETTNDIDSEMDEMKIIPKVNETVDDIIISFDQANIPVTIPLHQGYYMGKAVYYIVTDSSDPTLTGIITNNQDWQVNLAPLLANSTKDTVSKTYMFANGVSGDGVYGYQGEVFTSTPEQLDSYSALTSNILITWDDASIPIILDSEKEILHAENQGLIEMTEVDVVLNMPQIVWPEGQMLVKSNKTITDETTFVGGQIIDINLTNKTTTFIAHQGWDSEGRQIYFIVTDATPIGPANSMGVINVPKNAALISNHAAVDMFHFMNGIQGSGPLGFQAGITSSSPGDVNYSPMSRIYFIEWSENNNPKILRTTQEIEDLEKSGQIRIDIARPMNSDHVVNSPMINPVQLELLK